MDVKLTLKLEEKVISKAKKYAVLNQQSVSKLVEKFLMSLINNDIAQDQQYTPIVRSLAGIVKNRKNGDNKKDYTGYLIRKYK